MLEEQAKVRDAQDVDEHRVARETDVTDGAAESLADVIQDGDVIVTMGAGHISAVSHELPQKLAAKEGAA